MMEWISVEDRLPEYNELVLVVFENKLDQLVQSVAKLESVTQHAFENSPVHDRWYIFPSWSHEIKPTHWMPLPKPPEDK